MLLYGLDVESEGTSTTIKKISDLHAHFAITMLQTSHMLLDSSFLGQALQKCEVISFVM